MSRVLRLERFVMAQRLANVSWGTPGHGGWHSTVALTSCLPQGEQINEGFLHELYLLPEELPEELSPSASLIADSQSSASRQVHRNP